MIGEDEQLNNSNNSSANHSGNQIEKCGYRYLPQSPSLGVNPLRDDPTLYKGIRSVPAIHAILNPNTLPPENHWKTGLAWGFMGVISMAIFIGCSYINNPESTKQTFYDIVRGLYGLMGGNSETQHLQAPAAGLTTAAAVIFTVASGLIGCFFSKTPPTAASPKNA